MEIKWDSRKAKSNPVKHDRITFSDAATVFNDPAALIVEDRDEDEVRFVAIGRDHKGQVLTVIYTYPDDDTIRIISAWKAGALHRKAYENQ